MKWIMDGNRGLTYIRVMRTGSAVIYDSDYTFEFGKGHVLRESKDDAAIVVSSGRGVHEALGAASIAQLGVVDMPSIDDALLLKLYDSGKQLVFAEQNNGFIWQSFLKVLYRSRRTIDMSRIACINTLDENGKAQFIYSGTYEELVAAFGLTAEAIAKTAGGN